VIADTFKKPQLIYVIFWHWPKINMKINKKEANNTDII